MEKTMYGYIDNHRIPVVGHNPPSHINEYFSKAHSSQYQIDKGPGYPIKGFSHVLFNNCITPNIRLIHLMNDLLEKQNVLKDASVFNKTNLI